MVKAGIPCMSAGHLAGLARKLKGKKSEEIWCFLATVHPVLMENLKVSKEGRLVLRSDKYVWLRRVGWVPSSEAPLIIG